MKSRLELLKEFKEKKNTLKDSTNLQQKKDDNKKTILKPKVKSTTKEVKEKTKVISAISTIPTQDTKVKPDPKPEKVVIEQPYNIETPDPAEGNILDLEKFETTIQSVDQNYFLIQIDSLNTQVKQLNALNARLLIEKQSLNQELSQFEEQELQTKKQKQELEQKKKIQAKLEQVINELQSDLEKEKGLLKFNLEIGNDSIEKENQELRKQAEEKELKINRLELDIGQANENFNVQLVAKDELIADLQLQLDQARENDVVKFFDQARVNDAVKLLDQARENDVVKSLESDIEDLLTTVGILEERGDKDYQEIKELKLKIQQLATELLEKDVAQDLTLLNQVNEQQNEENLFLVDDGTDLALWQTQVDTVNLDNFEDTIILEDNDENSDDTINENLLDNLDDDNLLDVSVNLGGEIDEEDLIQWQSQINVPVQDPSQIFQELKTENQELKTALEETLLENQTLHNSLSVSNDQVKALNDENSDLKMVVDLQETDEKELKNANKELKSALEQTLIENQTLHQLQSQPTESKTTETLIENKVRITNQDSETQTTLDVRKLFGTLETTMKTLKLQNLQKDVYKQRIDQERDEVMVKYDQICGEKA